VATGHADEVAVPPDPAEREPDWRHWEWLAPLIAFAAAVAAVGLAALALTRRPLSTLEAIAVVRANAPFRDVLDWAVDHDPATAGYQALLHPVVRWSDAEWAVRTPSILAAALSCVLAYAIGALLVNRVAGAAGALALALNAGVVASSQQARPLALAVSGVLLATLALVLALSRSDWWWFAYVPACALLALTHPAAISILAAHACAIAVAHIGEIRSRVRAGTAFALAVVAAAPLALAAIVDRAEEADGGPAFAVGDLAHGLGRASGWSVALVGLAALGCVGLALGFAPRAAAWKAALVIGLVLAPIATVVIADVFLRVYAEWALVVAAPGLALACGIGVASIVSRWGSPAAVLAIVVLAIPGLVAWYLQAPNPDWRKAMARVSAVSRPGEAVLIVPEEGRPAALYYGSELRLTSRPYGPVAWVLVTGEEGADAIEAARAVIPTPRYALLSETPLGEGAVLQRWVRP
jgi:mannosyltransferase